MEHHNADGRERLRHWSIVAYIIMLALLLPMTIFLIKQEQRLNSKASTGFSATAGRPFSDASPWNTPILSSINVDPNSDAIVAKLATGLHTAGIKEFGVPIYFADASTPKVSITCIQTGGTCGLAGQQVPIPAAAQPSTGTDGNLVVVDIAANKSYEFYQYKNDRATTTWGGTFALDGDGIGNAQNWAVNAGLSRLAGVVRTYEIQAGKIDHALVFSTSFCLGPANGTNFRAPAIRTNGMYTGADGIPLGARIQLDPTVNLDTLPGITAGEKTVGKALQQYGAYAVDCGKDPMSFAFEDPAGKPDPYAAAGITQDHFDMNHLPWNTMRVLQSWNSSAPGLSFAPGFPGTTGVPAVPATSGMPLITPTFGVIQPCPSCASTTGVPVGGASTVPVPSYGSTVPGGSTTSVAPTTDPCVATNNSYQDNHKHRHHKKHSGGISNAAEAIFKFLLQLILLLLQLLLGGGQGAVLSPGETPNPCAPSSGVVPPITPADTIAPALITPAAPTAPGPTSAPVVQPTSAPFTPVNTTPGAVLDPQQVAPQQPANCIASGQKCDPTGARQCCTNACTQNINPNFPNDPGTCD